MNLHSWVIKKLMKDIKKSQHMAQFMYIIMDFYSRTETADQQGAAPQVASSH